MIASLFELDQRPAVVASLPAGIFGLAEQFLGLFVAETVPASVIATAALAADTQGTSTTDAILLPTRAAFDAGRLDPLTTVLVGTVDAVRGGEFLEFAIPVALKLVIKQMLDVLERNVVVGTAPWWHVLWIRNGHFKDASETRVAHAMAAFQLGRSGAQNLVVATGQALNPNQSARRSRSITTPPYTRSGSRELENPKRDPKARLPRMLTLLSDGARDEDRERVERTVSLRFNDAGAASARCKDQLLSPSSVGMLASVMDPSSPLM